MFEDLFPAVAAAASPFYEQIGNAINKIINPHTEFWLIHESERYQLPVNPETYTMSRSNANQSANVYRTGELVLWGPTNLSTITIASFFPNPEVGNKYICMYGDPWDTVKMINRWREDGKPTRVIITGTEINMECLIEKFEYTGDGGIGDVKFSIDFKEYRRVTVPLNSDGGSTGSSSNPPAETRSTPSTSSSNGKYTIVEGDCLWNIAKKYYNDGSQWTKIWDANSPMTSGNPDLIYPGEVITIP